MSEILFTGQLDVFSINENRFLRSCGKMGDLSELGRDEYFSFALHVQNNRNRDLTWQRAYVRVDGGEPWYWAAGRIPAFQSTIYHIYLPNMKKCMTPGEHTAVWYFDSRAVHQECFTITQGMKRDSLFPFPSRREIETYQRLNTRRSPYIAATLYIPEEIRYTEYMVDFRATHLPKGTYCCLGCWKMDYSSLEKQFQQVRTESGTSAYAGFQKIGTGEMVSIMSFWDIFCQDAQGKESTIAAKLLYPKTVIDGNRFWGEGTGARCSAPFSWEADHWYRMHLKCAASQGKTYVEQWVCDLETEESTMLCCYEIGVANSAFKGNQAVFLENYLPETAGEVRSMEVCNARYLDEDTKRWHKVKHTYIDSQGGLPAYEGSYNFGVTDNRIWMITSGVGGDWFHNGKGKKGSHYTLF